MTLLRRCFLALFILVTAPALAQSGDRDWLYRGSDIARDPAWTFGTLPNGLRYAVRRNALPKGQVSIRLRIDAGSLHERDEEQGWAHFVEHMAFRGTKGFDDGEAREIWQRLGASFGSDTNATTQPTQTVYQLDLPHADRASLDTSLNVLAEMADSALFNPATVEIERGVVLAEWGRRTEMSVKLSDLTRAHFYHGLRIADRNPIGTEATLRAATPQGLRAFYERWYRPDRATLVMVGDADPAMMESLIAARFGGWQPSGPKPPEPDYGAITDPAERTATLAYPGAPNYATLSWIRPFRREPHTMARERKDLAQSIAERILNRRLEAKARSGAAFLNAGAGASRSNNVGETTQLNIVARDGRWREAMEQGFAIVADAVRQPPSAAEIKRELDNLHTAAAAGVEGEPTLRSPTFAQRMVNAVDDKDVVTTAAAIQAALKDFGPQMTPELVGGAMREMFTGSGPRLVLLSPTEIEGGRDAAAAALAAAERAAPAERQADRQVTMADLPALGPPGREVSRQRIEDLDATIVRFSNGSSLVFKRTEFEKGTVGVQLRFGHGYAGLPHDRRTPTWLAGLVAPSGVAGLDQDGLERLLTGRRMSISFGIDEDAFVLRGGTSAAEVGDEMRLLATKLAFPRFDRALFERLKASALESYELSFGSASARAGREFPGFARGGDARWRPLEREEIAATTADQFEAFYAPLMAKGAIEAVVVGDVDLERVVAAMLPTVAALPRRPDAPVPPASLALRPPAPAATPAGFTHKGDPAQAQALIGWSTFGGLDKVRERRALGLAANMFQVRLFERLRDLEGTTYSPSASAASSESFPAWGIFYAAAELKPESTAAFFRTAREILADLAARPAAADEFERALNPILSGLERRLATNAYWLSAMEEWSRNPRLIEQTRTLLSNYRSMTAEEVRAAVAAHVADQGDWSMLILPGKAADKNRIPSAPAGSN